MERFMEIVLPIFIFAAFAAFVYHRVKAKKDGKKFTTRVSDSWKGWADRFDKEK